MTGLILLCPCWRCSSREWNWTPFDFAFWGALLFGTGLTYELIASKGGTIAYRAAVGVACATGFVLVWINAAVGIIGDGPVNLLYLGVLAVGFVGAVIARFQPRGMALALFATAVAQMLVPVIALVIWKAGWQDLLIDPNSPHPPFAPGHRAGFWFECGLRDAVGRIGVAVSKRGACVNLGSMWTTYVPGGMTMAGITEIGGGQIGSRRRIAAWAVVTGLILMIPLVAMQFTDEVAWTLFDFVVMGALLFGAGLTYELVARKGSSIAYRAAVGIACAAGLLLVWVNGAVGIIGSENNDANLMYFGVIAVGFIGAFAAQFPAAGNVARVGRDGRGSGVGPLDCDDLGSRG